MTAHEIAKMMDISAVQLETLLKMYDVGTWRFGIGVKTARAILEEAARA